MNEDYALENWEIPNDIRKTYLCNQMSAFRQAITDCRFLQSISIYDDHNVLLGVTNLNAVTWSGLFCYYTDIPKHVTDNIVKRQEMDSGIGELLFLNENRFVATTDDGKLGRYEINTKEDKPDIKLVDYRENESAILSMSYFTTSRRLVTGGIDSSVKVFDMNDFIQTHNYSSAHLYCVTSIAIDPQSTSQFVTTSIDGEALLWDIRDSHPARKIWKLSCEINAASWSVSHDPVVAIGAEDGSVTTFDLRNPTIALHERAHCERGVSKLLYHPDPARAHYLACGSCDATVKILDRNLEIVHDEQHDDFVTGLAWHRNNLYSCAWDGNVSKHAIPLPN